jgi:hypothetical protein
VLLPNTLIIRGPTPVEVDLVPGDYLIVAKLTDGSGRFQEVFRHVPAEGDRSSAFSTVGWRMLPNNVVKVPGIGIPPADVTAGMILVRGSDDFALPYDPRLLSNAPPVRHAIRPFLLDPMEFTYGEFMK